MINNMNHPNFATTAIPNKRGVITKSIKKAVFYLTKGDVVAIPTETVYGLAANIYNESALKKIFEIKQRPFFNPLIVHIDSVESLDKVAKNVPEKAYLLAKNFWPGPLTMILEKNKTVSDIVTADKNTVAVRVPNHPVALELIKKMGVPLAAPSANPFGSISPTTAKHVENYFKHSLDVILDGGMAEKGIESTIVGFKKGEVVVYRLGSISLEMLELVVGNVKVIVNSEKHPIAPGMLEKHYAPRTPMMMSSNPLHTAFNLIGKNIGLLVFEGQHISKDYYTEVLSPKGDMEEAAKNLYAAMHKLDTKGFDLLIAEKFLDIGIGKSINDRLSRACIRETNFTPNNIFI
ncbi:L-threonylcarbamoyladenylate synthase [Flavobacterium lacus]|uniref:Threonylcarbamoyl-AMP synthase n=1 Tax=Flavobacterium lacus TaxID=1353778 RepID=A0A328WK99_9FLAO|nr:L-threonylcarbamoyladenylate synthase [Flavobacterium lacus]RAR46681.1 translation factor SUA5 [Flavobacterium lacus]